MDIDLWHSDKNSGIQHDDDYLVGDYDVHADDIMMKFVCVCNEKWSLPSWAPEARSETPAWPCRQYAGLGLVFMMMMLKPSDLSLNSPSWRFKVDPPYSESHLLHFKSNFQE